MVAKFLDENKAKTSLKKRIRTVSNVTDLIQFHLICKILAKLSENESERIVSKLRKRKRKFLYCIHQLHKAGTWGGSFMSQTLTTSKKVQKSVMHLQSCCFANINRYLFFRSRCPHRRCCLSSPLLWSRNFATMVTWRHTSPLYSRLIKTQKRTKPMSSLRDRINMVNKRLIISHSNPGTKVGPRTRIWALAHRQTYPEV